MWNTWILDVTVSWHQLSTFALLLKYHLSKLVTLTGPSKRWSYWEPVKWKTGFSESPVLNIHHLVSMWVSCIQCRWVSNICDKIIEIHLWWVPRNTQSPNTFTCIFIIVMQATSLLWRPGQLTLSSSHVAAAELIFWSRMTCGVR